MQRNNIRNANISLHDGTNIIVSANKISLNHTNINRQLIEKIAITAMPNGLNKKFIATHLRGR